MLGKMCCPVTINLRVYDGITIPCPSNPIITNFTTETYICVHQKPRVRRFIAAPLIMAQTGNNPNVY